MMRICGKSKRGFSLVELLIGLLAAIILVLTAGAMVFHVYDAWADCHDAVNLHRDGRNAMDLLMRAVRGASAARVTTAVDDDLVILNEAGTSSVRFWHVDETLNYDPNTSAGGDEITLIADAVTALVVSNRGSDIAIQLELARGEESIQFDAVSSFRN